MAGNSTVRLVSGGTLQVRTGILKGVGPTGPTGPIGATGPAPSIGIGTVSTVAWGTAPTVTVSGSEGDYSLNFSIPGAPPTASIGTVTQLAAGATPTVSVTSSGSNLAFSFGIPQALAASGVGIGYQDFDYLSGLKMTFTTTSAGTSSVSVTGADAAGKAVCALLASYNNIGGNYAYSNWRMTIGGTDYAISSVNSTTGVITLGSAATTTSGTGYVVRNITVDSLSASETLSTSNKTADQGITVPAGSSKPFLPNLFKQMIQNIETRLVSRYTGDSDRSAKRSSRTVGEVTFLGDTNSLWVRSTDSSTTTDNLIPQVRISTTDAPATGTYPQGTLWLKV